MSSPTGLLSLDSHVCASKGCWGGLDALFRTDCSFAVGVSHKAPVVLSCACHLRVTDVGHLGAGAGWDWVDPPLPRGDPDYVLPGLCAQSL